MVLGFLNRLGVSLCLQIKAGLGLVELGAKVSVTKVANAWQDEAVVAQSWIDSCGHNLDLRIGIGHIVNSWSRLKGDQTE